MVIDTSAIIAILFREPDGPRFEATLSQSKTRFMSVVTRVELSFVVESRKHKEGRDELDAFFDIATIQIIPVDLQQMTLAIDAYRMFGKGRHKAALNIGDCFAYALAKHTNDTLLFKGNDFALTDIAAA